MKNVICIIFLALLCASAFAQRPDSPAPLELQLSYGTAPVTFVHVKVQGGSGNWIATWNSSGRDSAGSGAVSFSAAPGTSPPNGLVVIDIPAGSRQFDVTVVDSGSGQSVSGTLYLN